MLYTISLYLHIVGALVLFCAVGIEWMILTNLRKSSSREGILTWLKHFPILKNFFMTAFFLLLIPGIYMMIEIWQSAGFVIIGIIGLIVLSISGRFLSGGRIMAIRAGAMQSESESPLSKLLTRTRDSYLWDTFLIRLGAALGIVCTMTFKTDVVDSIIIIVVGGLLGFLAGKMSKSPEAVLKTES